MDGSQQPNGSAISFDQRKADILKMFDQRIADFQENRSCVQAAQTNDDLKTCRDKEQAAMELRRKSMGMQGGSGGPGGPMGR